jgi:hypothetical protein
MRCGSEEFEINFTLRSPFIIFASLRRRSIAGYVTDEQRVQNPSHKKIIRNSKSEYGI